MRRSGAVVLLAALGAASAFAQEFQSYVPDDRTVSTKEEVDSDLQRARLRLGPVRLIPRIVVSDAGYDSNVLDTTIPVADWTATFALGLRFIVPLGSKMYIRADALPQYTWYDKLVERRFFGGTYRGSVLGFFNRMTVELTGESVETYRIYSTELDARVVHKTQGGRGNVEVEVSGPIYLFGGGGYGQTRYDQEGVPQDVQINNNDQWAAAGGVRYKPSPSWSFSLGYAHTWTEFINSGSTRDNQSAAVLGAIKYGRPQLFINVIGGYREGRADNGSTFPEYSTFVGRGFISFFPIRWLELRAYGGRGLGYSLSQDNPYYFEDRVGGGINIELLGRILVRGFGDFGPNTYPLPVIVDGVPVDRQDDYQSYGGGISIKVVRNVVFSGSVSQTVYESNVPGNSRDYLRYFFGFNLSGEYTR